MEDIKWISKKELLRETGISYGQLYRWKRQHLIPESWFVKQSSFTGQETFFPRDQVLERIRAIQHLKDQYSLEELSEFFSPSLDKRNYDSEAIARLPGIEPIAVREFGLYLLKDQFSFVEVLFIFLTSRLIGQCSLSEREAERLVRCAQVWIPQVKGTEYEVKVYSNDGRTIYLLMQQGAGVWVDPDLLPLATVHLEELTKELQAIMNQRMGDLKR